MSDTNSYRFSNFVSAERVKTVGRDLIKDNPEELNRSDRDIIKIINFDCIHCSSTKFEEKKHFFICTICRRYITRKVMEKRLQLDNETPIRIGK